MTLLEVLAAFMIFSLVFTVLVGSSQNAVQTQGTSFRRLEADEIADSALAELEVELAQRQVPIVDEEEVELEPYTVRVREVPFGDGGGTALEAPFEAAAAAAGGGLGAAAILASEMPELVPFFRQYVVEVEWPEGNRKMSVRRTALGFDWPAASGVFAALLPAGTTTPGAAEAADSEGDGATASGSSGRNAGAEAADSRSRGARPPAQRTGSERVGDGTKKNAGSAWKNEVLRRRDQQLRKFGN